MQAADAASREPPNGRHRYRVPDLTRFAELTPRSAYWLGFLTADGCVSRGRETILVLHRRDEDHVRAFMAFLGCEDRPLADANDGTAVRLSIGCAALGRQLMAYDVVAGRGAALETPVDDALAASRDFWRGMLDGDGSLKMQGRTRIPQLQLVARPALARQFCAFLGAAGVTATTHPHAQSEQVLMVSVGGRSAQVAAQAIYGGSPEDVLARKGARAAEILAWRPQVESRYPWERWSDGEEWRLVRAVDYADAHRVWEAGRRFARHNGLRLCLDDEGDLLRLRFERRAPSAGRSTAPVSQ